MKPIFILCMYMAFSMHCIQAQDDIIQQYLAKATEKEQAGDKRQATYFLNEAASIEWERKNYTQAIQYYEESIKLNQEINNQNGIAMINNNIGMIYADMENYAQALGYFEQTLKVRRQRKEKTSVVHSLINLSVILNKLNQHNKAAVYLEEALSIAREQSDAEQMRSCYGMLAETYEKANNTEKSIKYFNLYRSFHELVQKEREDNLKNEAEKARLEARLLASETRNKELELLAKEKTIQDKDRVIGQRNQQLREFYETHRGLLENASRQELIINLLKRNAEVKEKDTQIKEAKLKELEAANEAETLRKRIITYLAIAGAIFFITILSILYFRYLEKKKSNKHLLVKNEEINAQNEEINAQNEEINAQKTELEKAFLKIHHQNKKITSSINYAQRIQSALLNDKAKLSQLLPESFIFFKPRDVVSGDFYWFSKVEDKIVLAAVDCTGHGVPGAFMSMLGSSLLRQITNQGINSPKKIMEQLHQEINTSLNQEETKREDGMDIALVSIDTKHKVMTYAGAHNPLIYLQNEELHIIKADNFPVGGSEMKHKVRQFTEHEIDISQPTHFYLYSDGYQDQFGGKDGRKFLAKRLRNILWNIHQKPMTEQYERLDQNLTEWKGEQDQIDDILVIGAYIK